MYANNGRQHQSNKFHTFNKNSSEDYKEHKDSQLDRYAISSKDLKSDQHNEEYVDTHDSQYRNGLEMNSLPPIGKFRKCI